MSKPLIGVLLGAVLGAVDGLTAWFTPALAPVMVGIAVVRYRLYEIDAVINRALVYGATTALIAIGFFARKFHSLPVGILFGLIVGAALAYLTALLNGGYYLQIILPGSMVGLIVGFATQKYGKAPTVAHG